MLISGRNVSTIYLLARDGHIVWRLGGKQSDFGPKAAVTSPSSTTRGSTTTC